MQYQFDWQCIQDRIFLLKSLFLPPYHQLTSWKPLEICVSSLHHNRPKIWNTNGFWLWLVINIAHDLDFIQPTECYVSILSYWTKFFNNMGFMSNLRVLTFRVFVYKWVAKQLYVWMRISFFHCIRHINTLTTNLMYV